MSKRVSFAQFIRRRISGEAASPFISHCATHPRNSRAFRSVSMSFCSGFPLGVPRLTGSREPAPVGEFLDITSSRTNVAHESFLTVVRWQSEYRA